MLPWRRVALWFLTALVVRGALLVLPLDRIDQLFIPDDTYYSLAIARHIAASGLPSADGVIPTNGFQPLITLLEVPFFLLHANGDMAVFGAVLLSATAGAAAAAGLGALVALTAGEAAGWLAAVIASLHPTILSNDLSGMETSLAALLSLAAVLCAVRIRNDVSVLAGFAVGMICGLTALARVDTLLLVGVCGLVIVARAGVRAAALVAAGALTVLLPWGVWIFTTSGALFPESGRAVRQLVLIHEATDVGGLATGLVALCELGRLLPIASGISVAAAAAGLAVAAYLLWCPWRLGRTPLALFLLCNLALALIYCAYLPAFWFLSRYWHPLFLAAIGSWAALATRFWRQAGLPRAVAGGATIFLLASSTWQTATHLVSRPDVFHGFREPARAISADLARFSIVAAVQSGALGYYAPEGTRVINLDGVVNRFAWKAMHDHDLASYLRTTGVEAFADTDSMRRLIAGHAGAELPLTRVREMPDARGTPVTLFALSW